MVRAFAASLLLASSACIVEAPGGDSSPGSSERAAAARANARPASVKNGANFGGKAELLGATFVPPSVSPAEPTRVTLVFRVLEPFAENDEIFVHVEDADGRAERTNVDHAPVGGRRPTTTWKKGEVIQDEFVLGAPVSGAVRALDLWVGLWEPKSDRRVPVTNPQAVRSDRDRVLLARLSVMP